MTTITIPNNLKEEKDLYVVTRSQYEMLQSFKNSSLSKNKIALNLKEGLSDIKNKRALGPFTSVASGLKALKKQK